MYFNLARSYGGNNYSRQKFREDVADVRDEFSIFFALTCFLAAGSIFQQVVDHTVD